ncbi:FadR/GntR family transcriptional regulator [Desulfitobacterium sp.]|uniref:FadR/GntR family transcriptional regulator n=1 Tax=Desulfitobacterium sp. TaxID=49981 RepID=UPI002B214B4A|nr:FadR/GntR family transcriptional regulator [Desulfitobacterium sp.]MEA4902399.1 FadR/GntR family transcriptional regulator [Desulfitobacterium sp.]
MELKPIKTRKIYEEIVERIREFITSGELQPGDRLPSERDMAERLQVSRASVREAFSALEMLGLLEIRTGEGTYIRQVNIESVMSSLTWVLYMEKDAVLELLEVRKILEVQVAALAAQRANPEDLQNIEEALKQMYQDLQKVRLGEHADERFHFAIAQATHNKILIHLMSALSDTMERTLKVSRSKLYEGKDMPERLYKEHALIYEAIRQQEPSEASERMFAHLAGVEASYLV